MCHLQAQYITKDFVHIQPPSRKTSLLSCLQTLVEPNPNPADDKSPIHRPPPAPHTHSDHPSLSNSVLVGSTGLTPPSTSGRRHIEQVSAWFGSLKAAVGLGILSSMCVYVCTCMPKRIILVWAEIEIGRSASVWLFEVFANIGYGRCGVHY